MVYETCLQSSVILTAHCSRASRQPLRKRRRNGLTIPACAGGSRELMPNCLGPPCSTRHCDVKRFFEAKKGILLHKRCFRDIAICSYSRKAPDATSAVSVLRQERGVEFTTKGAFYRAESMQSRDLAILAALALKHERGKLEVLDAMAASGVRGMRYLLQAQADHVWCNDLSLKVQPALQENLATVAKHPGSSGTFQISQMDVSALLEEIKSSGRQFDLVDIDSFGSKNGGEVIRQAIDVVRPGGLLYITSTDGLALSGRRPEDALRGYGALTNYTPAANEQALRVLAGTAVREGAAKGLRVRPLFCVFAPHGPVYRSMLSVELQPRPRRPEEAAIGGVAYCRGCGQMRSALGVCHDDLISEDAVPGDHPDTDDHVCEWSWGGPMWLGPLHDREALQKLRRTAKKLGWLHPQKGAGASDRGPPGQQTARWQRKAGLSGMLNAMIEESDPTLPAFFYNLDEVARSGALAGTPRKKQLMRMLAKEGYSVASSHVERKGLKTNAPLSTIVSTARLME